MASNMYGTTVACRMCYRDQYGTPVPRDVACLAKKPEARRWGYGYHLISRICQWKPRGSKSADGSLLGHGGCDVRCYSCGSHNSCECETEECDAAEGGASPYRYDVTASLLCPFFFPLLLHVVYSTESESVCFLGNIFLNAKW